LRPESADYETSIFGRGDQHVCWNNVRLAAWPNNPLERFHSFEIFVTG
jgi:hypothetical protein